MENIPSGMNQWGMRANSHSFRRSQVAERMRFEIHFTHSVICVPPLALSSREIGACAEFHGMVRELEGGTAITGLHYEAHEAMARTHLARHFTALAALHACDSVVFIHRLGWVPVGEASLYLRVLAAHRGPGLQFLAEAIERLKLDVPIWKSARVE